MLDRKWKKAGYSVKIVWECHCRDSFNNWAIFSKDDWIHLFFLGCRIILFCPFELIYLKMWRCTFSTAKTSFLMENEFPFLLLFSSLNCFPVGVTSFHILWNKRVPFVKCLWYAGWAPMFKGCLRNISSLWCLHIPSSNSRRGCMLLSFLYQRWVSLAEMCGSL